MAKRIKLENFEQTFNRKLTAAEAYANRPRFWLLYTFITLIVVAMVSWSSSGIQFNGLTVQGTEVAKGVLHGIFGPDTKLLFGMGDTDVPYLLMQTVAIAILGYVGAGGLGITINERIGWRDYEGLGMVLLTLFVVVTAIEFFSAYLRKKLS